MQEAARKAAESADFVPEVEEDEPPSANGSGAAQQQPAAAPAPNIHRLEAETNVTGGLQEMPRAAAAAGGQTGPAPSERPLPESSQPSPAADDANATLTQPAVAASQASAAAVGPTPGVPVGKAPGGLQSRHDVAAQLRRRPGAANGKRAAIMGGGGGMSAADAQAAVATNLARLSKARNAAAEEGSEEVRILRICNLAWW